MISVLVPSFNDVMLGRLFRSMEESERGSTKRVIVLDNGLSSEIRGAWAHVHYVPVPSRPFVFSQAFNLGVAAAPLGDEIVALGDDVRIVEGAWLSRLEDRFALWPDGFGLLTCAEMSTASVYGRYPKTDEVIALPDVALGSGILIPRRVLAEIGPWDESFVGYGFDDFDYGVRLLHAGYLLGITGAVLLSCLAQAAGWVRRLGSYEAVLKKQNVNFRRFHEKWFGAVPPEPWLPQRPLVDEHWNRASCRCLQAPNGG